MKKFQSLAPESTGEGSSDKIIFWLFNYKFKMCIYLHFFQIPKAFICMKIINEINKIHNKKKIIDILFTEICIEIIK